MTVFNDIIKQKKDMYSNPFFLMNPDNVFGFKKHIYKGYKVKYSLLVDRDIVLFGEPKY